LRAVHKQRHAILNIFLPPPPIVTVFITETLVLLSQNPWFPQPWRHLWRTPYFSLNCRFCYSQFEIFQDGNPADSEGNLYCVTKAVLHFYNDYVTGDSHHNSSLWIDGESKFFYRYKFANRENNRMIWHRNSSIYMWLKRNVKTSSNLVSKLLYFFFSLKGLKFYIKKLLKIDYLAVIQRYVWLSLIISCPC
jgi:hypothetical protein